jgi:hypothetical protein
MFPAWRGRINVQPLLQEELRTVNNYSKGQSMSPAWCGGIFVQALLQEELRTKKNYSKGQNE